MAFDAFQPRRLRCCAVIVTLAVSVLATDLKAQSRAVPTPDYYVAMELYRRGEYRRAHQGFRSAYQGGLKMPSGRWVDSICYTTMMGECLFQMGDIDDAMDQYTAAAQLYLAHQDWLLRIEFPATVAPLGRQVRTPTWGTPSRSITLSRLPQLMQSRQGQANNDQALRQGGVVAPPFLFSMNAKEIVRCTALAMRRRLEIMGPTCKYDPLTSQLVEALSRRPTIGNHWSQSWISLMLGMAYASSGKVNEAVGELNRAVTVAGMDYEMSGMALLEAGKLAFHQGNYPLAGRSFMEATYTASAYEEFDVMREAFEWATIAHIVSGQQGVFAPLVNAAAWAKRNAGRPVEASLYLCAAENAIAMGDVKSAAASLSLAQGVMRRSDMARGSAGARVNFISAQTSFKNGKLGDGIGAFRAAMAYQRTGSPRLFQIALADRLYTAGAISRRNADLLFAEVLREPNAKDWAIEPMETFAVLLAPNRVPMEHWFDIAMSRKEHDKALMIADRVRRHRFYSTLPLGGRLLSLRWILQAPEEALSQTARLQRQEILNRQGNYRQLELRAAAIRDQLAGLPLVSEDAEEAQNQKALYDELANVSGAKEVVLHDVALQRVPTAFTFPPLKTVEEVQQGLSEGQRVLAFFTTQRTIVAFLISRDDYISWLVGPPARIRNGLSTLLRQMGNFDKNQQIGAHDLLDEEWKTLASQLLQSVTNNARADFWDSVDELIIVPDGVLWYVPFEALPLPGDGAPLLTKTKVRYAPTLGLTVSDGRGSKPLARTAVVVGRLFPRDDDEVAQSAFQQIREVVPGAVALQTTLPAPSSLLATSCDRLVVLSDLESGGGSPYNLAPMVFDRGKTRSALGTWLALPFGAPDQVILPGFHTAAENSLKRGATGDEIFLTVTGLMSCGTRSILLSRWRTGGRSSFDLVREYVQELPHASASEAWQRSVQLLMESDVSIPDEPRVKPAALEAPLKATHPFFWSGYALIDTGQVPER